MYVCVSVCRSIQCENFVRRSCSPWTRGVVSVMSLPVIDVKRYDDVMMFY